MTVTGIYVVPQAAIVPFPDTPPHGAVNLLGAVAVPLPAPIDTRFIAVNTAFNWLGQHEIWGILQGVEKDLIIVYEHAGRVGIVKRFPEVLRNGKRIIVIDLH